MATDPNELKDAEAEKLMNAERERDLRTRIEEVKHALEHITDDDRRRVLNEALDELKSRLTVHDGNSVIGSPI